MGFTYYYSVVASVVLFVGMLLMIHWGRCLGKRALEKEHVSQKSGTGVIEGSVFALMGLMIAFTFSNAASRFDNRRQLIIEESNAIGTAYHRIDLMPAEAQPHLRDLFKKYLGLRIQIYKSLPNIEKSYQEIDQSHKLQDEIWAYTMSNIKPDTPTVVPMLLLPALNQMFDIENQRNSTASLHIPIVIVGMLFVIGLVCALLAGFGMAESQARNWIYKIVFCVMTALTFYTILDLEYPRLGFVRLDSADATLIELLGHMK